MCVVVMVSILMESEAELHVFSILYYTDDDFE